jgi:2'-hydroxyisoflavone reductase
MEILVLGGTKFVGRHTVEAALARRHEVTLFNRGTITDVFPGLEQLRGDRNGDLEALRGRTWDAVIDTSGYIPRQVRATANLLEGNIRHYTFISSISVYADETKPFLTEEAELETLQDESVEEVTGKTYGGLKVLCEKALQEVLPGRSLIIRPGLIVGPHDPTDRFTYWPHRVDQGGEVLAPAPESAPVQFIDARDLAAWTLQMLEQQSTGVFNVVTPPDAVTMEHLLQACRKESGRDASFTWVSDTFLQEQGVAPFMELPLWIPGDAVNFMRMSSDKARAAGLVNRPVQDTVRDTLTWDRTLSSERTLKAGLEPGREAELLRLWHARQG